MTFLTNTLAFLLVAGMLYLTGAALMAQHHEIMGAMR